ncbi:glycosyltransferase family 4 protein [Pseudothermotoga thermarum]|uniref:Glycosyl transferase group 1 n=1 Tax=Pseudothermotoga thermarum DSM 5069 TaxID=688269 RepID=F7YXD5_9THEM|nr:glycosyltransferase family 4 protein [Pseudothermotoga thermarum]AEH51679.1 glycosyl transferase group 1 [Pseudothermotoga thermarum DSM 5069]
MKIGLCHFRAGFTDGVSLEMEKFKKVLEKMGHTVFYIAGDFGNVEGFRVESLSMKNERNLWIHRNAFEKLQVSEQVFVEYFNDYVAQIERELEEKIPQLDLIFVNNIFSLGFNLAGAVAVFNFTRKNGIKTVSHNHDFYWERPRYSTPTFGFVVKILEKYFPPKEIELNLTINKIAQEELFKRKGINSIVVPNVFDFDQDPWVLDEYNNDLRDVLGIDKDSLFVLHATRIVPRKAIEIAMDFAKELQQISQKQVNFVIANFYEDESIDYYKRLAEKAESMPFKTHFAFDLVRTERFTNGRKYYSLWDMYANADLVTYTSVAEGWGNQLIEAVFAKKPLVVFEYPVYITDIKPLGFEFFSLGDYASLDHEGFWTVPKERLRKTAQEVTDVLSNKVELSRIVEKNFEIGKRNLSLTNLAEYLNMILEKLNLPCDEGF